MAWLGMASAATAAAQTSAPTNIAIESRVLHTGVKHFGINLSGQSFYDSGQMLRDIAFRNPGFEGSMWQSVLQCKFVNGDACADGDEWSAWQKDFAKGATFEFIYGAAKGEKGTVTGSTVPASAVHQGVWVSFGNLAVHPHAGDFYVIRRETPGNAAGGWWTDVQGGASMSTEFHDIASESAGKQCLRIDAAGQGQSASVSSFIDTSNGRSFLQLNGGYTLTFRAKALGGAKHVAVSLMRATGKYGNLTYFTRDVPLTDRWQDFKFPMSMRENGSFIGPIHLAFVFRGTSALLDDVALTEAAAADNPTAFRNAVVRRLRDLQPGVLRYMDSGTNFGSSLDNLLAPPFARRRAGYSESSQDPWDVAIGLHEFLVLCEAVKTEPWFVIPVGSSQRDMHNLIEYLTAPASRPYGAKRVALGQVAPWTSVFPKIHLELGNEIWNWGDFPGEGMQDPKAYGSVASDDFAAARATALFDPAKFDLIMSGWCAVPWWNQQELLANRHADTIDIGPYTFIGFNNTSSPEAIFGPMFAEPESIDSRPAGMVAADAKVAEAAHVQLAAYEVNLGVYNGKADQAALDAAVPSLGAGIAVADHMLLMLRDDGILTQAVFALPEYSNGFHNTDHPEAAETMKLWGTVVDMGGQTNRVRPTFLAEKLANSAIADRMLATVASGANPTWDQEDNGNAKVKLAGAHLIQSFAFTDGERCSLVLFNLSRGSVLSVTLSGPMAPARGPVEAGRLTSAHINDTNELAQTVDLAHETVADYDPSKPYPLPPYSMTVLTWKVSPSRGARK